MSRHEIMGGLVQLYRRNNSPIWSCSTTIDGKQYRTSTKKEELQLASIAAEDWYLDLRGKSRAGVLENEESFAEAAEFFLKEYPVITKGERSQKWTESHEIRLRLHILPFLGKMGVSQIHAGTMIEYRIWRSDVSHKPPIYKKDGKTLAKRQPKPPSRSTLHDEIGTVSLVLQSAYRRKKLTHLPDLSEPYRANKKVIARPWFPPEDYKKLYEASRENAKNPKNEFFRWEAEQLHDFILLVGNSGLRPDEAANLEHRDVSIIHDDDTNQQILLFRIRGKRGEGLCKSMPGAVQPYTRLRDRPLPPEESQTPRARRMRGEDPDVIPPKPKQKKPQLTDRVFPGNSIKMFNNLLEDNDLKFDRDGKPRTAYSLRHTYICMRLLDRADIYELAKNCRTSVEMIEKHYAAHIATYIDAGAVNVRRKKKRKTKDRDDPSAEQRV